jgi:hypothetical protein
VPDDVWPDRAAALRASGRPPAGFRGLRRGTHNSQECRKTPQDAGRGQSPRSLRTLQRQSCVGDDGARQPELGVGGQDQPGPSVGLLGMTHPRHRPAQGLFHEAIACSRSNLREYALQMRSRSASSAPPQPELLGFAGLPAQLAHLDQDHAAPHHGRPFATVALGYPPGLGGANPTSI